MDVRVNCIECVKPCIPIWCSTEAFNFLPVIWFGYCSIQDCIQVSTHPLTWTTEFTNYTCHWQVKTINWLSCVSTLYAIKIGAVFLSIHKSN